MTNQRLLTSIVLLVLAIWIANLCYCSGWEPSERGTFGEGIRQRALGGGVGSGFDSLITTFGISSYQF